MNTYLSSAFADDKAHVVDACGPSQSDRQDAQSEARGESRISHVSADYALMCCYLSVEVDSIP